MSPPQDHAWEHCQGRVAVEMRLALRDASLVGRVFELLHRKVNREELPFHDGWARSVDRSEGDELTKRALTTPERADVYRPDRRAARGPEALALSPARTGRW